MYSASVGGNILYVSVKSTWPVVQVFCFFIDLRSRCSICYQKWGVEVSYYYWLLSTSSFNSVMVYFIYLGALMLGSYIFIIVICSWWIVLLSLYSGLLYLCDSFDLKPVSSDVSMATPALFCLTFMSNVFYLLLFSLWKVKVLVTQSCLTLGDPLNCSPPGSSVHGILQARILEWVAIPFSMVSSQSRDWTWASHIAGRFWATREALNFIIWVLNHIVNLL